MLVRICEGKLDAFQIRMQNYAIEWSYYENRIARSNEVINKICMDFSLVFRSLKTIYMTAFSLLFL